MCPQGSSVGSIVEEILSSLPHFSLSVNVKWGPAGLEALVWPRHLKSTGSRTPFPQRPDPWPRGQARWRWLPLPPRQWLLHPQWS